MLAAGLDAEEDAPSEDVAEPEVAKDEQQSFESITLEVAPTGLHAVAEAPRNLGSITSDEPASCPNCNGEAHLDMVDLVGHTMHYTCTRCGAMWQVQRSSHTVF